MREFIKKKRAEIFVPKGQTVNAVSYLGVMKRLLRVFVVCGQNIVKNEVGTCYSDSTVIQMHVLHGEKNIAHAVIKHSPGETVSVALFRE